MLTKQQKAAKQQKRATKREAGRRHARHINAWFENIVQKAKHPDATDSDKQRAARITIEKAKRTATNTRKHHSKKETRGEATDSHL